MDKQRNDPGMIDFLICPGFCVKDNRITQVNDAAGRLFLSPGMEILPLLVNGQEEYTRFTGGCLCLTLNLGGRPQGAFVSRVGDQDIFLADEETELRELQVLALAAQELRMPLTNIMIAADRIRPEDPDEKAREHCDRMSRGTAQLLRLVSNMSDAFRYSRGARLETRNVSSLLREVFQKAQMLLETTGLTLHYQEPDTDVYMLADGEQLERAVYNILSNALKFTPQGGHVEARLTKTGSMLRLTVEDSGSGIGEEVLKNLFTRYLRQPSLEDSRMGLGLGMVLIRAAAFHHGGTVLVDQPGEGTRITLTLAITQSPEASLRSPVLRVDYAGERDHALLELSDSLPSSLYRSE